MNITILSQQPLPEIYSASGIEILDNKIFIIADNSSWLYSLNRKFKLNGKIRLFPQLELVKDDCIPKFIKPDLEAFTSFKNGKGNTMLLFGSGSLSPKRDNIVLFDYGNSNTIKVVPAIELYATLRDKEKIGPKELNIEAATVINQELFLFNRGNNIVLKYNLDFFLNYLNGNPVIPVPEVYKIKLPQLNGISAGFSGAASIDGENKIVFTASVENTANWIDDGEVLGSFIGTINTNDLKDGLSPGCISLKRNNQLVKLKIEGVAVANKKFKNQLDLLLITDSDGGTSEILEVRLFI